MSDQDNNRDHDNLDWLADDESSSHQSDDASENEHRSDGEKINSLVPASEMLPERIYLLPIHNRPFSRLRYSHW